ncbi:MAG: hypothetical protein J5793_00995, partial [Clostridia bacterium]|nr:hypothetical protein [Clostridia bacterium]
MKLLKIVLSIILAVCFMSSLVITYGLTAINAEETSAPEIIELCKEEIPATMDYETAFGKGHVKRMYDEESDLNTAVFLNGDGSRSLYLFYENIKYVDESGVVRDKSNALSESEGGYENEANDLKVRYGKSVTEGVKLSFDKYEIVMTPVEASQSAGPALPKSDEKSGEINGVTYANVFGEGTSVVYTQSLSGVKEDIVLEYDTGKRRFSFCVKTNGARLEQAADESGKIYVVDPETGKRISELSGITAWDSAGLYAKGKYTLGDGANENEYIV